MRSYTDRLQTKTGKHTNVVGLDLLDGSHSIKVRKAHIDLILDARLHVMQVRIDDLRKRCPGVSQREVQRNIRAAYLEDGHANGANAKLRFAHKRGHEDGFSLFVELLDEKAVVECQAPCLTNCLLHPPHVWMNVPFTCTSGL